MNKEIKEILDFLDDDSRERPFGISNYDIKVLRDYITNLEQEKEEYKRCFNIMAKFRDKALERNIQYKSRIDKALKQLDLLKYIDKYKFAYDKEFQKVINILTGGDEE